jgi:nucleoside-diphosphate-sugar epimerase
MSTKHYLVTGGTGFIGASLVKRLVKDGHKVRVLDNNSRGATRRIDDVIDDVELVETDIRDTEGVIAAAKGVDCICHLAAVNGTEFFYSKPELVLDVGIRGTLAVIDACRANDIGDLVYASSSEVYQTPPRVPTDENVPLSIPDVRNPRYSYGGGKIASELIAMNHGRIGFDRVTVFRPHNVYGPDMGWEHVLPQFVLRAKELITQHPDGAVPFPIQGDGSQTRAFIHIDDFTDGLVQVIDKGEHLEIYHIGNPEEVTVADLARRVLASMGRETKLISGEEPRGATPRRSPDITKLRGLGFEPKLSLDAGLSSLVDWYVANANMAPAISN